MIYNQYLEQDMALLNEYMRYADEVRQQIINVPTSDKEYINKVDLYQSDIQKYRDEIEAKRAELFNKYKQIKDEENTKF